MSNIGEEEKQSEAGYPLDLASKIATVKTADGKTPLLLGHAGPPLRNIRILPQQPVGAGTATATAAGGATIIATNIVSQGMRQITLPFVGPTSTAAHLHVPRGASVVANLAAPRGNIRAPLVVTAQAGAPAASFVRPTRTPSPAGSAATTWISSTTGANGSQVKGTAAVLTAATRTTTITTGKPTSVVAKPQVGVGQIVSTIKPNTTILQSAIIGQNQLQFKNAVPGIQTLNTTVALAQVVPSRTQTLVYSAGAPTQFAGAPRIAVATPVQQRTPTSVVTARPMAQVTATRLAVPVTGTTRLLAPQGAVLTPAARITNLPAATATPTRIISTTQALGRLTVTVTNPSANTVNPILTQMRSTLVVPTTNVVANRAGAGTKVIAQPTAQGTAIHLSSMPITSLKTAISPVATTIPRTMNAQTTIVAHRPTTVVGALPIGKGYTGEVATANLYLQTPVVSHTAARRASPGPTAISQAVITTPTTTVAAYTFYDATATPANFSVARTYPQQQGTTITAISSQVVSNQQQQRASAISGPQQVHVTASPLRLMNPRMVVEHHPIQLGETAASSTAGGDLQNVQTSKLTSSPRPSILRKRDHDGSVPLKAAKNLMSSLANIPGPPLSPPSRPDSRNNGHSSGGSTTISATSSPGLADGNDDSNPPVPMNKEEEENRPPIEMSPRKKPRKQNLAGNDMDEHHDDMQFLSEREIKHEPDDSDGMHSDCAQDGAPEARRIPALRKPAAASLLNSYKQTWKTTNNHYMRYTDVRPKEERRPTIIDLSNQHRVMDKVNGWKIHHLSTQMEDLAEQEHTVHSQLSDVLKFIETRDLSNPDINKITELIKGNMQRVKIIKDGMVDANSAIMKIFDHKVHVSDIISRCASKRNYKKREKT